MQSRVRMNAQRGSDGAPPVGSWVCMSGTTMWYNMAMGGRGSFQGGGLSPGSGSLVWGTSAATQREAQLGGPGQALERRDPCGYTLSSILQAHVTLSPGQLDLF